MNLELKTLLLSLFFRFLLASVVFLLGLAILLASGPAGAFMGFFLFLVASILLAFPLAGLGATLWNHMIWPKSYYNKPQPMYGIPQSRRAKGQLEEALAEYEKIAAAFPDEVRPWFEMIDLAIHDLKDAERARSIFERGIARLKNADDKDLLAGAYAEIRTRLDVPPPHAAISIPASL